MNVSQETINILYELIKQCFEENRWFDRVVSVIGVKFAMNNTSKLIHKNIAHLFPQISDQIGEKCLERYNIDVKYGSTKEGTQDYNSPKEIIQEVENHCIDFQNMLIGAVTKAQENGDLQIYVDLLDILKDFNSVVEQVILLNDKVVLYEEDFANYDAHIEDKFWILGE